MHHRCSVLALALLGLVAFPVSAPVVRAVNRPLLVVVASSSSATNIEIAILRRAFSGLPADLAGTRLIAINHPTGSPLRTSFDKQVLGLAASDVGKFWIDKRIRDEGSPPKSVPSAELAIRVAASLPGAITYGSQEHLVGRVKALSVDGKSPAQAGYPLSL